MIFERSAAPIPRSMTDEDCDQHALQSAVDVLRTQQAQPHRSTQRALWEAIKDYAERSHERDPTPKGRMDE